MDSIDIVIGIVVVGLVILAIYFFTRKKDTEEEPKETGPKAKDAKKKSGAARTPKSAKEAGKAKPSKKGGKPKKAEPKAKEPDKKAEPKAKEPDKKAKEPDKKAKEPDKKAKEPDKKAEKAKEAAEKAEKESEKAESEEAAEKAEDEKPAEEASAAEAEKEAEAAEEEEAEAAEEEEEKAGAAEEEEEEAEAAEEEEEKAEAEESAKADERSSAAELAAQRKDRRQAFRKGLKHTRGGFIAKLGKLLKGKKEIDSDLLDQIEEVLLTSDVGMKYTERLTEAINEQLTGKELADPDAVWTFIQEQSEAILSPEAPPFDVDRAKPFVIMVVGVNGVGKTTTIAKLASRYIGEGRKVVLAAGDTFRAAAVRQLEMWGDRVGAEVVKNDKQHADPSSVLYEAVEHAVQTGADVVIADTAGRLHTKSPLMDELKKCKRVMNKALEGAPHEVLLVLDANTGQNANQQTQKFKDDLGVTGIVLTKLDGTAKGGVILGICEEHGIPVRFVGVGERDKDLREFDAEDFVAVLFERPEEGEEAVA